MKRSRIASIALLAASCCAAEVTIVVPPTAQPVEKFAGSELAACLGRIYPEERFVVKDAAPAVGKSVVFARRDGPPESFSISPGRDRAVIASADARGSMYAVYSLLDHLGCGFYLSYETLPPTPKGSPDFASWKLEDAPLVSARQATGMEPVRVRIGKVETEPLAQGAGQNTFYYDEQNRLWRVLNQEKLAGRLRIGGIMGDRLESGRYRIEGGETVEVRNGFFEAALPASLEEVVITRIL